MSAVISVVIRSASLPHACWSARNIEAIRPTCCGGTVPDQIVGPHPSPEICG
jgi:hypothetical protein